jgi:DNA-binding MarR family transcriptional regulator
MTARARESADAVAMRDAVAIAETLEAVARIVRAAIWEHARSQPGELTPPQILALEILVRASREGNKGLSLSALSTRMGLAHSTVSGILDRLAARGLVERRRNRSDRRSISVELTEPVLDWLEKELPSARYAPLATAISKGTPEQRALISDGLLTLRSLLAE